MYCTCDLRIQSFIHQQSSWSHLQVSVDHFQKLLITLAVSPAFLDCVHCFGAKVTGDDNPLYSYCNRRLLPSIAPPDEVEKNHYGRPPLYFFPESWLNLCL